MKLFKTLNIGITTECQLTFNIVSPSVQIATRTHKLEASLGSFVNLIVSYLFNYSVLFVYCVLMCYHICWCIKLFIKVWLCDRVVTVATSHARESGFNSQSRQAWLRLPSFWGRLNEQQLFNSGWLLLKIANVTCRSGKTMWIFISPVGSRQLKRTCEPHRKSDHLTALISMAFTIYKVIHYTYIPW